MSIIPILFPINVIQNVWIHLFNIQMTSMTLGRESQLIIFYSLEGELEKPLDREIQGGMLNNVHHHMFGENEN